MKALATIAIIVAGLAIGFIFIMQNMNINRLGTEGYYLQITIDGKEEKTRISQNEIMTRYEYNLPAVDKEGNAQTFSFTSEKQLRKGAYLTLYIKDKETVMSYQELKFEEIPQKAADQLKENNTEKNSTK
ncbi:YxeA family protein [Paenibacillus sp. GSMTC-2017]|uniref:YxeA family protein n=1 Tax=Paenibacillus sp. GSMTC-2017 TaxID=2794350 RepID=UPI0018D94155|nr:YxeA family protein [Paenibacillus sp. GSMTC-2017]MBH5317066.1 YxeA family protein [Paenibacillus sp. GSMTC-2017]